MRAPVNKILPFSCVDGPGNRTVIFMQGCNIDCKYCHNPETRDACAAGILQMTPEEAYAVVRKSRPFIRGISVSGGECMLYPDFLTELFTLARADGLGTLIDSNGTISFRGLDDLLAVSDGVMLDIKAYEEADHIAITGHTNQVVLDNAVYLAEIGKLYEVRCVICPDLYDGEQSVRAIAAFLAPYLSVNDIHIKVITYRPNGVRPEYARMTVPGQAYLQSLAAIFTEHGFQNVVVI